MQMDCVLGNFTKMSIILKFTHFEPVAGSFLSLKTFHNVTRFNKGCLPESKNGYRVMVLNLRR